MREKVASSLLIQFSAFVEVEIGFDMTIVGVGVGGLIVDVGRKPRCAGHRASPVLEVSARDIRHRLKTHRTSTPLLTSGVQLLLFKNESFFIWDLDLSDVKAAGIVVYSTTPRHEPRDLHRPAPLVRWPAVHREIPW